MLYISRRTLPIVHYSVPVSSFVLTDSSNFIYSADNFEPFLSQILKIRWEDELGKENPLKEKEYR